MDSSGALDPVLSPGDTLQRLAGPVRALDAEGSSSKAEHDCCGLPSQVNGIEQSVPMPVEGSGDVDD